MALRTSSGILRLSMLTATTHEDCPLMNWLDLAPVTWSASDASMPSQLRVVASGPLLARMPCCTLMESWPNLNA
ncbi:MAG: hypothetical protein BWY91_01117 [bacterium ADurb.BinA028]|nr:MAG: hypothetical protein BWY91_01117 [bacterium ADurb.BinA028]